LYDVPAQKAHATERRIAVVRGIGLSCIFFSIYAAYGLGQFLSLSSYSTTDFRRLCPAFSFGTTLINQGHANPGQIVNVIMAILIGSFSLAMMAPEMQGTNLFT
jgi:ATP-binding cassette subfamily B (MDR/TAP) protein 1